jgi:hypothetical protein
MRSHLLLLVSSFLAAVTITFGVAAQEATITVSPREYATPAEQLAAAEQLKSEIGLAADGDSVARAVAHAAATAQVVAQRWPDDDGAVVAAAILQADVMLEGGWTINAREVLETILPRAERIRRDALVHIRLAKVSARLNDTAVATRHADRAIRPSRLTPLDARAQAETLRDAAHILTAADRRRDAAACWRRAANVAVVPFERATYAVAAAKAHWNAGERAAAREDAMLARKWLAHLRATPPAGPGAFEMLNVLESELDRMH